MSPRTDAGPRVALDVAIEHLPIVNLALQHIDVPVVSRVVVTNRGTHEVGPLAFTFELDPPVAPAFRHEILDTLRPGEAVELDDRVITMPLSSSTLARQLELEHGTLRVTVAAPDGGHTETRRVDVLAFDAWAPTPHPETLACFVQPSHPALAPLLTAAQDELQRASGEGALGGYEGGARRVRLTAAALARALAGHGVRLLEAPAIAVAAGEKLRLPEAVVADRLGSGLDLTLLYASLVERAGLHPVLVRARGRALVGVLLVAADRLSATLGDDASELVKRVDLVEALVVDVAALVRGETLERAEALAAEHLRAGEAELVLDVAQARRDGILPLPTRLVGDVVVVPSPAAPPAAPATPRRREAAPLPSPVRDAGARRLERWKGELLDLSLRNPLLAFKRDARRSLPLVAGDIALLEDALASRQPFSLVPLEETGLRSRVQYQRRTGESLAQTREAELLRDGAILCDLPPAEWHKRTLELYRAGKSVTEETGSPALWLALGFVHLTVDAPAGGPGRGRGEAGAERAGAERTIAAPILLVPVTITRGSPRDPFRVTLADDEPRINSTLLKKLALDHHLDVAGLDDLPEDDAGVDVPAVLERFRRLVLPVPRCQVVETAAIGFFSFAKYLMWLDLEARSEALVESPVVKHLLGGGGAPFPLVTPFVAREDLDARRPPSDDLAVVDADSSQLVAVQAAVDGNTFVLEGPPGTGKSQTITNVVAELMGRGKSVLFVAEKRAAVDVVQRRLEAVGLGPFVLDVHAPDQSKAEIVAALAKSLERKSDARPGELAARGAELQAVRDRLAATWDALHAPDATEMSVWQAVSRLAALEGQGAGAVIRHAFDAAAPFDAAAWRAAREATHALGHACRAVSPMLTHPFAAAAIAEWDAGVQLEIGDLLAEARAAVATVHAEARALGDTLGVTLEAPSRASVRLLHELAQAAVASPPHTTALVGARRHEDELQAVGQAVALREQRRLRWEALAPRWHEPLLKLDLAPLHARFERWQAAFVIFAWFMLFFARRRLRPVARERLADRRGVTRDLAQALLVRQDDEALAERRARAPEAFPDEPLDVVVRRVGSARALIRLRRELQPGSSGVDIAAVLERAAAAPRLEATARAFHDTRTRLDRPLERLARLLEAPALLDEATPLEQLGVTLSTMEERLRTLRDWAAWRRARAAALDHRLEPFVAALEAGALTPDTLEPALERSALSWRIADGVKKDPVLRRFRGADHEDLARRFRELDALRQAAARDEIVLRLIARLPDGSLEAGEVGVLRAEAKKRRRHLPLRKLFAKIPTILPRLTPCVLASPMSVAAYLPPDLSVFDVVVFDEASQIPPWDAIGALARGHSAVVVGDSKQMPPTSFFSGAGDDEPVDDDDPEELESILDECDRGGLQKLSLSWHYRSRHPSLIQFSNHRYYGGELIAFPAAVAEAPTLGVKWRRVEGRYQRGERQNRVEAEALVGEVLARLRDPATADKSIGVVTFAEPQQRLVLELLDRARAEDPSLEPHFSSERREPVMVKNLENVQGDERDVMFFSVGFGPGPDGKVSLNLGALNRKGGERRLNVAVTRARELLVVYSSIDAAAIDPARVSATGVRHLREFLEFAERGGRIREAFEMAARGRDQAGFLAALAARLVAEGFAVDRDLAATGPRIDLAVRDPERPDAYLAGVVTDSVAWARFPSLRDREKLGPSVLHNLGWAIIRVFALDMWQDPEREIERVLDEVRAHTRAPRTPPPSPAPAPAPAAPVPTAPSPPSAAAAPAVPARPTWLERALPYARLSPPIYGDASALAVPGAYTHVAEQLAAVIVHEGPVHRDEALRRAFASWQVTRVGPKMARQAEDGLHALPAERRPRLDGDFYWPPGRDAAAWRDFRVPGDGPRREVEHLPPEEIGNALTALVARAVGLTRAEALVHLGAAFGFDRRGKKVDEHLARGIALAVAAGRVHERDGRLEAGPADLA